MNHTVQEAFLKFYDAYCASYGTNYDYDKVAHAIMRCKTGELGCNTSLCEDCGLVITHNNSCRNRNCPNCQAIPKELWVDARKAEMVDAPYYHVVFTLPCELNPLLLANQKNLYSLFHRCVSQTITELAADEKFLGAKTGIIQVLHTWGQELQYHPHIHCIVLGGGLTPLQTFKTCQSDFFIPVYVLSKKFRGKFISLLREEYNQGNLCFSSSIQHLQNSADWNAYMDDLFQKEWIPFIKETFNGAGNAIEYLGRYTHRIAITNSRILNVSDTEVTFAAKDYRTNQHIEVTLQGVEFIRRFLMHVLPTGFVKIRNYGILCNSGKKKNLQLIRTQTRNLGNQSILAGLKMDQILLALYGVDIHRCPCCQSCNIHPIPMGHRRS